MYTWLDITSRNPEEAKISILGIPFDGGQTQEPGAAKGPAKVREFAEKFMPRAACLLRRSIKRCSSLPILRRASSPDKLRAMAARIQLLHGGFV